MPPDIVIAPQAKPLLSAGTLGTRFYEMVLGWGAVTLVYFCTAWLDVEPVIIAEIWLDRKLEFSVHAIWLYLSFFVLIPYTYFSATPEHLPRLRVAMQVSAVISGLFFVFMPSTLAYPLITQQGFSADVLKVLTTVDSANNCFPSLHASLTTICIVCVIEERRLTRSVCVGLLGVLILVSIIVLRRHLSIDVGAGVVLGLISYCVGGYLQRRRHGE